MDANDWFFDLDPNNWIFEVDPKILIGPDPDRFNKSICLFFYQSLFIIYYFQKAILIEIHTRGNLSTTSNMGNLKLWAITYMKNIINIVK